MLFMPSTAQRCPLLVKAPPNGTLTCSHPHALSSYGSRCEFQCNEGFWLRGASAIACNSSGVWSQDMPTCHRECWCMIWNPGIHWSYTPSAPQPCSVRPFAIYHHLCLWTAPIPWKTSVLAPNVFSPVKRDFLWTAHRRWCVPPQVSGLTRRLPAWVIRYLTYHPVTYYFFPHFNHIDQSITDQISSFRGRYAIRDCLALVHGCGSISRHRVSCSDWTVSADYGQI